MSNILGTIKSERCLLERLPVLGIAVDNCDELSELHIKMLFADQINLWLEHLRQCSMMHANLNNWIAYCGLINRYPLFRAKPVENLTESVGKANVFNTTRYKSVILDDVEFVYEFEVVDYDRLCRIKRLSVNTMYGTLRIDFTRKSFNALRFTEVLYKMLERSITNTYNVEMKG